MKVEYLQLEFKFILCVLDHGKSAIQLLTKQHNHNPARTHACTHTHTHVLRPSGLCPGLPGWTGARTNLGFTEARDS